LAARLAVHLPGVDRAQAEKIVHAAHQICPYSNATRGNIDVQLAVE
jgi:osmotically inducible protein OsmC